MHFLEFMKLKGAEAEDFLKPPMLQGTPISMPALGKWNTYSTAEHFENTVPYDNL